MDTSGLCNEYYLFALLNDRTTLVIISKIMSNTTQTIVKACFHLSLSIQLFTHFATCRSGIHHQNFFFEYHMEIIRIDMEITGRLKLLQARTKNISSQRRLTKRLGFFVSMT